MTFITLQEASLAWGDAPLLDGADLTINEGQRLGLIGRNGTGKSSLLKVLAGVEKLDSGEKRVQSGLKVVYVEQEPVLPAKTNLLDSLMARAGTQVDEIGAAELRSSLVGYLHRFGLSEALEPAKASGGEKKKAALALALAEKADLLLLDEPTNHLDIEAIFLLEELLLSEFKRSRSLVVITHDRAFLNRIAEEILELDRGILRSYPGSFDAYQKRKNEELATEEKQRAEFDKFWAQEEVWIRKGIEARRTRNEGRVRRLEQIRREREARRDRIGSAKLTLDVGQRSGKVVAELENVTKSFGDRTLIRDLSMRVLRGDKVGLLGPNGVGKSTLVKIILGQLAPDAGKVKLGTNLQVAYFDQLRGELDGEKTLVETVSPGSDWVEVAGMRKHVIGYLGEFLFPPHRVNVKVASLSGGERNRLLLAKLFAKPANLLVMDEPTNDLDIESLELLEDTLQNYSGTVILVSHDRAFMDNVATFAIAPDEQGSWQAYVGGYEEWTRFRDQRKKAQLPPKQKAAARVKVKKIKLTYNEEKELAALPAQLEALESSQNEILERMQQPGCSSEQLRADGAALQSIQEKLEALYERWEQLETKQQLVQSS